MNCIKEIDKIMHNTDSEAKSFRLYQLDKIYVAILYLVVYIVKDYFKSNSHQNTREVVESSPPPTRKYSCKRCVGICSCIWLSMRNMYNYMSVLIIL